MSAFLRFPSLFFFGFFPLGLSVRPLHSAHLVLVLDADGRGFPAAALERGEQIALRARLGAGVQAAQLQEVLVLGHVLESQGGHHHALLQEAAALRDGTGDGHTPHTHLEAIECQI